MGICWHITDYQSSDFPEVLALWEATGMGGAERGDDAEVVARTLELGGTLLVMREVESNALVGTSWMTQDGRRAYLHHFAISPRLQGKGLGWNLLIASLDRLQKLGLQVKLEVRRDNLPAQALYRKGGFSWLGPYDTYIHRDPETLVPGRTGGVI